jgi:hypothetical protein
MSVVLLEYSILRTRLQAGCILTQHTGRPGHRGLLDNNIYYLQLGFHPVAMNKLHVYNL